MEKDFSPGFWVEMTEPTKKKAEARKRVKKTGCTFVLEIKDTQSQSWQGKIKWIEGQKEETFRSVLEMITLLDSVVQTDKKTQLRDSQKT